MTSARPERPAAIVTNIPTPYRAPVFDRLGGSAVVVYCARSEPNRSWRNPTIDSPHVFLKERFVPADDGFNFRHNNPDVWRVLGEIKPSAVVISGLNPTHLYAAAWAFGHRVPLLYMTDGTARSEQALTWRHRLVRRVLVRRCRSFIAASQAGAELLQRYGAPRDKIFICPLAIDNERFAAFRAEREFDVMFAGQFHERKMPLFFAAVCQGLAERRGVCRALIIGDGPLRDELFRALREGGVDFSYAGFVQQDQLPQMYGRARLLLFPTEFDAWGLVANEALASGTPVITTPDAGVAGELVVDGKTGAVLPADVHRWVELAAQVLDDRDLWAKWSSHGRELVQTYSYEQAAEQLLMAIRSAGRPEPSHT